MLLGQSTSHDMIRGSADATRQDGFGAAHGVSVSLGAIMQPLGREDTGSSLWGGKIRVPGLLPPTGRPPRNNSLLSSPFSPAAGDQPFPRLGGYHGVTLGGGGAFLRALGTAHRPAALWWEGTFAHIARHRLDMPVPTPEWCHAADGVGPARERVSERYIN